MFLMTSPSIPLLHNPITHPSTPPQACCQGNASAQCYSYSSPTPTLGLPSSRHVEILLVGLTGLYQICVAPSPLARPGPAPVPAPAPLLFSATPQHPSVTHHQQPSAPAPLLGPALGPLRALLPAPLMAQHQSPSPPLNRAPLQPLHQHPFQSP